jgi:hypothetical protein
MPHRVQIDINILLVQPQEHLVFLAALLQQLVADMEAVAILGTLQIADTVQPVDPVEGHQDTVMVTAAVVVQGLVVKDLMVPAAVDNIMVVAGVAQAELALAVAIDPTVVTAEYFLS